MTPGRAEGAAFAYSWIIEMRFGPGQIAHLNHNSNDSEFDNLVFLCLEHHDQYDGKTSQSKNFTELELRHWRDELYRKYPLPLSNSSSDDETEELPALPETSVYSNLIKGDEQLQKLFCAALALPTLASCNEPEYFCLQDGWRY